MKRNLLLLGVLLSALVVPTVAGAAPIAIQTFDDPHGWFFGGGPGGFPATPFPVQLGGQGGAADPFLLLTSTGTTGPQSRLSAINTTEFTGDYTAAGVTAISMDFRNFGTTDLYLRLLLVDFDPITGAPTNVAVTFAAVSLAGGSAWQTGVFDVSAGGLTLIMGSAADLLANVDELRLFHNPDATFTPGQLPAITATLGVDNISTGAMTPVPEPATLTLMLGGIAAWCARTRRGRRSRS